MDPPVEASGDFDPEVAALFSRLLREAREAPEDGAPRGRLGMAYAAANLPEAAAQCFDQARAMDPGEPRWWYHAALTRADTGDLPLAAALMDSVIARESDFAPAWWRRGEWLLAVGDLEGAESCFLRATELKPDHPGGWVGLARVRLQQGRAADASEILEGILAQDSLRAFIPYVQQLLGTAYARLGRLDEAKVLLARGRSGRPPWSDRWERELDEYRVSRAERVQASVKALKSGRYDQALEILEPLRESHPGDVRVLEQIGVAYFNLGRLDEAEEAFQAWIALAPEEPAALQAMSAVRGARGDVDRALELARRALELNPRQTRGHRRLAEVLLAAGRPEEALE
ncbi:MAG TPA: tetratricopeptide repeat protein, partial [bacterium]|nr:tetratricopeptide repeat protein [bacterium]